MQTIEADLKLDKSETSDLMEAIKFGNWFVIWGGFIFWAFQILRSGYLHCRREGEQHIALWAVMHLLLFIANFLYLWYELQYSYIPLYFSMIFCTDIVGIWGLYLLTRGAGGEVGKSHLRWFKFCSGVLCVIFVGAFTIPEHGMKCHPGRYPLGLSAIVVFYIFWSIYVVQELRTE